MAGPLGSTPGIIVGVGVGAAASAALQPAIELPRQKAWQDNPNRILDPGLLGRLVAQGGIDLAAAKDEAARDGYAGDKLDALVYLAQTVPPVAEALTLWRRGHISDDLWTHVLVKNGLDARYLPPLNELKTDERLAPPVIALAIVRGIMDDPGFLPVGPPTGVGKVPKFPTSPLDTLDEAASMGWDKERLFVQTAISGRPMGPEAAASATFRQIIERVDFDRAISEGDVRNEWAEAIFETSRQIASASNYVTAHLKGWIDEQAMYDGAARHGMSQADAHLLFLAAGRPAAAGQMATAIARGIDGPDGVPMDEAQFLKGIRESDIRPEWGPMLYGIRHAYPPLFQINRLVQAGAITPATALAWAKNDRYAPDVLAALAVYWGTAPGAKTKAETKTELADEYAGGFLTEAQYREALTLLGYAGAALDLEVAHADAARNKQYREKVIAAIHGAYLAFRIDQNEASNDLASVSVMGEGAARLVSLWDLERRYALVDLTQAQIVKAAKKGLIDQSTAVARLEEHGLSADDALIRLEEG